MCNAMHMIGALRVIVEWMAQYIDAYEYVFIQQNVEANEEK